MEGEKEDRLLSVMIGDEAMDRISAAFLVLLPHLVVSIGGRVEQDRSSGGGLGTSSPPFQSGGLGMLARQSGGP